MGKFSESSYTILEEYFTQLIAGVGEGDDNSYLTGTRKAIFAKGGLSTTLYQKQDDGNFVGFKFDFQSLSSNDFKFQYKSKVSLHTLATDLQVGSEMYFRKDSLFHDWLKNNAASYENAINTNKTHIYFGKIFAVTGETNNYNIIFDGLKDFVTYALPEHQRTDKITELLKIFFDAVYHDIYNMTKTMWSFIDAKEVNIDHIDYLATRAGISTNKDLIESEDLLREFVDQLIFWLKRKGTYTSYLLPYKLLARNTKNKLNFYERWVEWCLREFRQNIDYIPETDFYDHHYKEYYGVTPTGGAGPEYYSRYDHNSYPDYTDIAPSAGCNENRIICSQARDWDSSTIVDDNSVLTDASYNLQIDGFNPGPPGPAGDELYVHDIAPTGGAARQTPYCLTVSMTPSALPCGGVFVWAMSNHKGAAGTGASLDDHITNEEPFIGISFEAVGRPPSAATTNRRFKMWEYTGDGPPYGRLFGSETSGSYAQDTEYHLTIHSTSASPPCAAELVLDIYSDASRRDATFLEQVKLQLHEYRKYNSLYSLNYLYQPSGAKFYGDIQDLYYGSRTVEAIPLPSGNFVPSPHYKIEIDLSSEPFGEDYIINENLIDELIRYWDYLRPVSKYVHFHELLSPIARIEDISEYQSLYDPTLTATCDTKFIGTYVASGSGIATSAAVSPSGSTDWYVGTAVHVQPTSLLTWVFQHNLGTKKIITQVFNNDDEWVLPARLNNETANLQRIEFSPARRGRAFGAQLKPYNKSIYQSTPATAWNIVHNMGTSGVSGVLCQVYNDDLTEDIIPDQIQEIDLNTLKITFDEPASGYAFVRDDDYHFRRRTPSTEWKITHNLDARGVIVQFKDHEKKWIYPENIYIDSYNQVRGVFSEAVCGTADLIIFQRAFEEADFNDTMAAGYWKVGTGGDQEFDPEIHNDLATTVLSGAIVNWSETTPDPSGSYIAEFSIPTGKEYTLNEMGLFNNENVMQFYTKMNTLHKPTRVQLDVFYRIRKQ